MFAACRQYVGKPQLLKNLPNIKTDAIESGMCSSIASVML